MSAIHYVIRDGAGAFQRGAVIDSELEGGLNVANGGAVSLNLRRADVQDYVRAGNDLELYLADGRKIILNNFFNDGPGGEARLFLNEGGYLIEADMSVEGSVSFVEAGEWGKWSELDALIFPDDPVVIADAVDAGAVAGAANEVPTQAAGLGLLGAGASGLSGLVAPILGGAGVLGGLAMLGGGKGGVKPTVDDAGGEHDLNGESEQTLTVTGTAEPGSTVVVTVGDQSVTTETGEDGTWSATFTGDTFPEDGNHTATVTVTNTDGSTTELTGPSYEIDTVAPAVAIGESNPGMGGLWINSSSISGDTELTGTGEPGAAISVNVDGVIRTTTVTESGTWSVTYESGSLAGGEYTANVSVTATDSFGNVSVTTGSLAIDTVSPNVSMNTISGNDVVNAAEYVSEVTVNGTGEPGATVQIEIQGHVRTATVDASGSWSVVYEAGVLAEGDYETSVNVTSTDLAGNTTVTTSSLHIDTLVRDFATSGPVETDNVISGAEASDGVTLSGTVEAGSMVVVQFGAVTKTVTATAEGTWSVDFSAAEVPGGEYDMTATITATDPNGNTQVLTQDVTVDTIVRDLTSNSVTADNVVNAAEAHFGMTLTGTTEAGSTSVWVNFDGINRQATVDAAGNWSVEFTAAEVGSREENVSVTVTATDAVGNVDTLDSTVAVDTIAPDATYIASYTRAGDEIRAISVETGSDDADVTELATDGSVNAVNYNAVTNPLAADETMFGFSDPLPDGSHLLVTRTDAAGNSSTNLLASEDTTTDVINLGNAGLEGVNIDAIDLRIAENSDLTISAETLEGLSENSNVLTIHGSEDDTLNIDTTDGSTFAATGETVTIGSDTYNVYTLGDDGGRLIVDDEINIVT
ncbi:MAG: hypothetical protein CR993_05335 [Rhodobacterales bacterium]|nr:MAG: hypothetical protein CR993_05335 [Rhodobacterales bacterium]